MIYAALLLGSLSAFVAGEKATIQLGDCLIESEPGSGNIETNCLVNGVDVQAMKATLVSLQVQVSLLTQPPPSTPPPVPPPPTPPPPYSPPPPQYPPEYYGARVNMGQISSGNKLPCFNGGSSSYVVERSGYFFIAASVSFGSFSGWGAVSLCVNGDCSVCKSVGYTDGSTLERAGADLGCSTSLTAADTLELLFEQFSGGSAKWATVSIAALYHAADQHPAGTMALPAPYKSFDSGPLFRGQDIPNANYVAPKSGRYLVACNAVHGRGGIYAILQLHKIPADDSKPTVIMFEAYGHDDGGSPGGGTDLFGVIELDAGDGIKVMFQHDSGLGEMDQAIFSVAPLHFMDQVPLPEYFVRPSDAFVGSRNTFLGIFENDSTEHTVQTTGTYVVTCNIKHGAAGMFAELQLQDQNDNTLCSGYGYDNGAGDGRSGTDLVCTVKLDAGAKIKIHFMHDDPAGRVFRASASVTQIVNSYEIP